MRRPAGDDGNALVEFTYLAVLLMLPLVYLLTMVFQVQRASFGVTEAARQAGRAYATASDEATGRARAQAAAQLALRDQGISCGSCLDPIVDPLVPDGRVRVRVSYVVQLPVIGAFFAPDRAGVDVEATHIAYVDRFREAG